MCRWTLGLSERRCGVTVFSKTAPYLIDLELRKSVSVKPLLSFKAGTPEIAGSLLLSCIRKQ
jgi:hypothetical protein